MFSKSHVAVVAVLFVALCVWSLPDAHGQQACTAAPTLSGSTTPGVTTATERVTYTLSDFGDAGDLNEIRFGPIRGGTYHYEFNGSSISASDVCRDGTTVRIDSTYRGTPITFIDGVVSLDTGSSDEFDIRIEYDNSSFAGNEDDLVIWGVDHTETDSEWTPLLVTQREPGNNRITAALANDTDTDDYILFAVGTAPGLTEIDKLERAPTANPAPSALNEFRRQGAGSAAVQPVCRDADTGSCRTGFEADLDRNVGRSTFTSSIHRNIGAVYVANIDDTADTWRTLIRAPSTPGIDGAHIAYNLDMQSTLRDVLFYNGEPLHLVGGVGSAANYRAVGHEPGDTFHITVGYSQDGLGGIPESDISVWIYDIVDTSTGWMPLATVAHDRAGNWISASVLGSELNDGDSDADNGGLVVAVGRSPGGTDPTLETRLTADRSPVHVLVSDTAFVDLLPENFPGDANRDYVWLINDSPTFPDWIEINGNELTLRPTSAELGDHVLDIRAQRILDHGASLALPVSVGTISLINEEFLQRIASPDFTPGANYSFDLRNSLEYSDANVPMPVALQVFFGDVLAFEVPVTTDNSTATITIPPLEEFAAYTGDVKVRVYNGVEYSNNVTLSFDFAHIDQNADVPAYSAPTTRITYSDDLEFFDNQQIIDAVFLSPANADDDSVDEFLIQHYDSPILLARSYAANHSVTLPVPAAYTYRGEPITFLLNAIDLVVNATGPVHIQLQYDDNYGIPEEELFVFHFDVGNGTAEWERLPVVSRDPDRNSITVIATGFSPFALGASAGTPPSPSSSSGGSDTDWRKKPTFGRSWEVTSSQLVRDGFTFNNRTLDVSDNWHTDFARTSSVIGEQNTVTTKVYAADGLLYTMLSLGVPAIGEVSDSETDIVVYLERNYTNPDDYDIVDIVHEQKENLVDENRTTAAISKSYCNPAHEDRQCHTIRYDFAVQAPLMDDVLAIGAVDQKRRSTTTYINDGVEFTGQSLLAPATEQLFQKRSNQDPGLFLELVQQDRRYEIWEDQHGYLWTRNGHGSWLQISHPEHVPGTDAAVTVMTRMHSAFDDMMHAEGQRASLHWDSSQIQSSPGPAFAYDLAHVDDTPKLEKMADQLQIEQDKARAIVDAVMRKQSVHEPAVQHVPQRTLLENSFVEIRHTDGAVTVRGNVGDVVSEDIVTVRIHHDYAVYTVYVPVNKDGSFGDVISVEGPVIKASAMYGGMPIR